MKKISNMKRKAISVLIVLLITSAALLACGPYKDYAGSYKRSNSRADYTVTLSASGDFRYECVPKESNEYDPLGSTNNTYSGTYSVENGVITIEFTYYNEVTDKKVKVKATAKLSGKKLTISDSDLVEGQYTKR